MKTRMRGIALEDFRQGLEREDSNNEIYAHAHGYSRFQNKPRRTRRENSEKLFIRH